MASRFLKLLEGVVSKSENYYSCSRKSIRHSSLSSGRKQTWSKDEAEDNRITSRQRARSYSLPTSSYRVDRRDQTRKASRYTRDTDEHTQEVEEEKASEEERPYYFEATRRDFTKKEPKEIKKVEDSSAVQYELEATRPKDGSQNQHDILDYFSDMHKKRESRLLPHLQPNNLRPYGSTDTLNFPSPNSTRISIRYPVIDTFDGTTVGKKSKEVEPDDVQRRDFSTFKYTMPFQQKENPGYQPVNKMARLIRKKEAETVAEEDADEYNEESSELKRCNELIDRQKKLNLKYLSQNEIKRSISEEESPKQNKATTSRYSLYTPKSSDQTKRKKFEIQKKPEVSLVEKKQQPPLRKPFENIAQFKNKDLPWPDPELPGPATVRSTLPINVLQANALPDEPQLYEKIVLGPNQKLAVPWPSYSERVMPKKMKGFEIVYPSPPPPTSDSSKMDQLHRSEIQKRGISTEHSFRLEGGLFSNDCRLRHVLCKKEVVDSIREKSNMFRGNVYGSQNSRVCTSGTSAIRSSSSGAQRRYGKYRKKGKKSKRRKRGKCEDKRERPLGPIICNPSIRKREPKKKSLPILVAPDCPCIEAPPMTVVELRRLKPRYKPRDPKRVCKLNVCPSEAPRADDGLKIRMRDLPILDPKDCPCKEVEMKDAPKIKRLIAKEVKEKKKIPICKPKVCPPRADAGMKIVKRTLPLLRAPDCPCAEEPKMTSVPLKRLPHVTIKEPKRICPHGELCTVPRADDGLKVKMKDLPPFLPQECPCYEPIEATKAPKLRRLAKVYIKQPRRCKPKKICYSGHPRADRHLRVKKKKLPVHRAPDCPCTQPPEMTGVKLKKLKKRYKPKDPKRICIDPNLCNTPRADDGLKVKYKDLPKYVPKFCPCVETEIKDSPPIKRLPWREVKEPVNECKKVVCSPKGPQRADHHLKIRKKKLKPHIAPDCPCPDDPPYKPDEPLKRLDLYVPEPKRVCIKKVCAHSADRADDGLKIKMKDLPKLEDSNCPCVDLQILKPGKKLKRLETRSVPKVPKRVCKDDDPCRNVKRADKDDWQYAVHEECKKRAPRLPKKGRGKNPLMKGSKRKFYTNAKSNPLMAHRSILSNSRNILSQPMCRNYNHKSYTEKQADNRNTRFPVSPFSAPLALPWKEEEIKTTSNRVSCSTAFSYTGSVPAASSEPEYFFRRPITTSTLSLASARTNLKPSGKCKKLNVSKGSKCSTPKFKLNNCPPRARMDCKRKPQKVSCVRQNPPYPSFSEGCEQEIHEVLTECAKLDYLQPNKPIIRQIESFSVPPPKQEFIDPSLEDHCIRQKLGIPPKDNSAVCAPLKPPRYLKQKDFIQQLECNADAEVEEKDEKMIKCQEKIIKCQEKPQECGKTRKKDRCRAGKENKCGRKKKKNVCEDTCEEGEMVQCRRSPCKNDDLDDFDQPFPCCIMDKTACQRARGKMGGKRKLCPEEECMRKCREAERNKNLTLWERIVNYFKARPDCPSPEEIRKRRLREDAEKMAAKAGLCVYDPKEICEEQEEEMPEIITGDNCRRKEKKKKDKCNKGGKPQKMSKQCKKIKSNCQQRAKYSCGKKYLHTSWQGILARRHNGPNFPNFDNECSGQGDHDSINSPAAMMNYIRGKNNKGIAGYIMESLCPTPVSQSSQSRQFSDWKRSNEFLINVNGKIEQESKSNCQRELTRRVLVAIKQTMKHLESRGYIDVKDPYYCLFKKFSTLSEEDLQEYSARNRYLDNILSNTVMGSLVRENEDNISNGKAMRKYSKEEKELIRAFEEFCMKITGLETKYHDVSEYERLERAKTESVVKELDELLEDKATISKGVH